MNGEITAIANPCWLSHQLNDGHTINDNNAPSCMLVPRFFLIRALVGERTLKDAHELTLANAVTKVTISIEQRSGKGSQLQFSDALLEIDFRSGKNHNEKTCKQSPIVL